MLWVTTLSLLLPSQALSRFARSENCLSAGLTGSVMAVPVLSAPKASFRITPQVPSPPASGLTSLPCLLPRAPILPEESPGFAASGATGHLVPWG